MSREQTIRVAAIVVAVAVGAVATAFLLAGNRPGVGDAPSPSVHASASSPESPAPSLPDASVEPTPVATAAPDDGWQVGASFGEAGAIEEAHAAVQTDGGFYAVGTHYGVDGGMPVFGPVPQEGRIWHSVDGRAWEDVTPADTFADAGLDHLYVTTDGALVAIGVLAEATDEATPMTWESRDGSTWAPVTLGFPGYWTIERLAAGARGYLALVRVAPDIFTTGEQGLWLSADGRSWELVREPVQPDETFTDIGAGNEGFAVLGFRGTTPPFSTFAMASADGRQWVQAATPPQGATVIVARGGDWIAAGATGYSAPPPTQEPVWFSANGLEWNRIGTLKLYPVATEPDGTVVCSDVTVDLLAAGDWLVSSAAAGYGMCSEGRVSMPGTQQISRDGVTWQEMSISALVADSTALRPRVVAALSNGQTLILVGHSGTMATFWYNETPP